MAQVNAQVIFSRTSVASEMTRKSFCLHAQVILPSRASHCLHVQVILPWGASHFDDDHDMLLHLAP
jgi:hypothetical protein